MSDNGLIKYPGNGNDNRKPSVSEQGVPAGQKPAAPAHKESVDELADFLFEKKAEAPVVRTNSTTAVGSFGNDSPTVNVSNLRKDIVPSEKKNNDIVKGANASAQKRNMRRRNRRIRVIFSIIAALLGLFAGLVVFGLWYKDYLLSKPTYFTLPEDFTFVDDSGNAISYDEFVDQYVEPTEYEIIVDDKVANFLLIGIDSRSRSYSATGTGSLADVIMIMSVDSGEGTIKMISIARDSYAYVPGYQNPMKINASMSLGGPELLKLTIENQLRITIDGYAFVNFYNMASVIDAVGGVYVDLTSTELYAEGGLNHNLAEVNNLAGLPSDYQAVNSYGYDTWLNGRQAVAYARIRKVDSDYMRSERQVEVLRSLMDRFLDLSITGKAAALDDLLPLIATNISSGEITDYALDILPSLSNLSIQYMQLPIQDCFNSGMYGDEWSIRPNWNAMIPYVHEFFYNETTDFDLVRDIPNSPSIDRCPDDLDIEDLLR